MERPARIALAGPVDDRLAGELRSLPLRPEVRVCTSLVADSEVLLRLQPDVLMIGLGGDSAEEIGALRFLRQLWPALGVVVVTNAAREVLDAPLAAKLHALLLVYPDAPGQLAAIVEQARVGGDRPRADVFVDLARGVADEINNPLMNVAGQLQLLRASLQALPERDRRDQVAAALAGVARIAAAVERLRLLSAAASGPRRRDDVDLTALLRAAIGARPRREGPGGGAAHAVDSGVASVVVGDGPHVVRGDPEHLEPAVQALVRFADDLAAAGGNAEVRLDTFGDAQRLRIAAGGATVAGWQLPHTFEPYYPFRVLRGQAAGLGLFLVQTVVLGHRGQATARRQPDGSLVVDFVLPAP
jgi:signal transduction histidine kinase